MTNTMTSSLERKASTATVSTEKTDGCCINCLQWLTKKLRLVEDGATPPNWKYIGLVFLALFSSSSTLTFLFPFLPEMMLTLGYTETEKGTYVGIVASAVFAGRIVGSVFWGWLADRRGRKLVLLVTIALNGIFAGLFGFAKNLALAVIFRFLCGAANGTVGTGKAVLYDISDNTNQALSMTMISIAWGMGMIIGPTVGGILASPAGKWPQVFSQDGLFGEYPYLMSSLFPFFSCLLIFIIILLKFDETLVTRSSKRGDELTVPEAEDTGSNADIKDSHHPLLGGKGSQSFLQICQSMHSVHAEAEAATYMALGLVKTEGPTDAKYSLGRRTVSVPDNISKSPRGSVSSPVPLKYSKGSYSVSDIYDKSYCGANLQVISENSTKNGKPNSLNSPSYQEFRTKVDSLFKNGRNKSNQNGSHEQGNQTVNGHASLNVGNGVLGDHKEPHQGMLNEKESSCLKESKPLVQNSVAESKNEISKVDICVKSDERSESTCQCVESCHKLSCCRYFRGTSLYNLLRLSDVWATTMIYTIFSMAAIALDDIFPVFASTREEYGGLGFSADEIGFALGAIFLPLLLLQVKLYPYLVSKMGIRKVFVFSATGCLITSQLIPLVRLINNRVWLWICLLGIQIPFKIATNCCFAGTSLLINNSVSRELAGQVNGLAMMTTATGRTIAPMLAGSLFSWTVTYGQDIGIPFDTSFPFFVTGAIFFITVIECMYLNPALDKQKK